MVKETKESKKTSRTVKKPTAEGKVTKAEVKKAVKKTKEVFVPVIISPPVEVVKEIVPEHVSEPLNMFFVPKTSLVRFKPRELRTGRYTFDTSKRFIVLFEIDQIPNHLVLVEIPTGKVVTMIHSEDLEMVPVDEA